MIEHYGFYIVDNSRYFKESNLIANTTEEILEYIKKYYYWCLNPGCKITISRYTEKCEYVTEFSVFRDINTNKTFIKEL